MAEPRASSFLLLVKTNIPFFLQGLFSVAQKTVERLNLSDNAVPHNKGLTRKEEPTRAPTPDKLDRALRDEANKSREDGHVKPYPLTEEEATPNTPQSEYNIHETGRGEEETRTESDHESRTYRDAVEKNNQKEGTSSDYNRLVSRARKR